MINVIVSPPGRLLVATAIGKDHGSYHPICVGVTGKFGGGCGSHVLPVGIVDAAETLEEDHGCIQP